MNATYPTKELFARITEPIQRWAIEALAKGTERELWQYLYRVSAGSFGRQVEVDLKEFARFAKRALDTVVRALNSLIKKGLVERPMRMYDYGCRLMLHPPNLDLSPSNSEKLTEKQPSNPHSLVTYSLESLKEELTTREESFTNSPEQKEGIRSNPAPKLKPQNPEPNLESGTEPTTEALGLIAEYGVRCGSLKLASKKPVQQAIANIARNLSPEKLMERVRGAISATEEVRVGVGLRLPIEYLLSKAIREGFTSNASKKAEAKPVNECGVWLNGVLAQLPSSIFIQAVEGVSLVYRFSDQVKLGTFEELRDLPIEAIGRLVNPSSEDVKMAISPIPLSPFPIPAKTPPVVSKPSEDEVITARALIPAYEEKRGITRSDRPSAISGLIGATVSGLTRLDDTQLIQYLQALQKPDPPE